MKEQLKAEAYVRSQRPVLMELTFGCEVTYKGSVGVPKINMAATVLQTTQSGSIEIYTSYTRYVDKDELTIIGHPIQLQDWLAVLGDFGPFMFSPTGHLLNYNFPETEDTAMMFNPDTGQPATEADYKAFNDIVGI